MPKTLKGFIVFVILSSIISTIVSVIFLSCRADAAVKPISPVYLEQKNNRISIDIPCWDHSKPITIFAYYGSDPKALFQDMAITKEIKEFGDNLLIEFTAESVQPKNGMPIHHFEVDYKKKQSCKIGFGFGMGVR